MKTVLITGAGPNGVTGRLLKEALSSSYDVLSPSSAELDLTNSVQVANYFDKNAINYIIHCATFRPLTANKNNFVNDELESNLRMYFNLSSQAYKVEKVIYFGSGAEFDKSRDIVNVSEDQFGEYIPRDCYGFAKYLMCKDSLRSSNVYNIRLFGTINPYERFTKNVVSNLCVKAIKDVPITLRRDCRFSFVYVPDILKVIDFLLNGDPKRHDYNVVMDKSYLLSDVANAVLKIRGSDGKIEFVKGGLNCEYTASSAEIVNESGIKFTSLQEAIRMVYTHYERMADTISTEDIDARWKGK